MRRQIVMVCLCVAGLWLQPSAVSAQDTCSSLWNNVKAKTHEVGEGPMMDVPNNLVALVSAEGAFEAAGCIGTIQSPPSPPPTPTPPTPTPPTPTPPTPTPPTPTPPAAGACGMQMGQGSPAFCDTFDSPSAVANRSGQLNPTIWGVSRTIGGGVNFGQKVYNQWASTLLEGCAGTTRVTPPFDVIICNGQLREASNDNVTGQHDAGDVTVLAMYPKQPFDWAGRDGTVSFDVSNDSHGTHAAWPEFWVTDLPIPAPFTFQAGWVANPQHGFGIRLGANVAAGNYGFCPNADPTERWTVDSAVVIRNYLQEDTSIPWVNPGNLRVNRLDCVTSPTGPNQTNHVEFRINQNQIDVYASNAGTKAPLKRIATITGANLSFSRGLIWLEDVHYNADKGAEITGQRSQREHTFAWDNVAFDGPFTYRDLSYDAPDTLVPGTNGSVNLGKFADSGKATSWTVPNLPASATVSGAVRVLFNYWHETLPTSISVTVNGHAHSVSPPDPDTHGFTWRTLAVTIPKSDLVAGNNTVTIGGNQALVVSNVNIVLVNATVP